MEYICVEAHGDNWMSFQFDGRNIRVPSHVSDRDGHARISMPGLRLRVALAILDNIDVGSDAPSSIIRRIHSRTHLHPR